MENEEVIYGLLSKPEKGIAKITSKQLYFFDAGLMQVFLESATAPSVISVREVRVSRKTQVEPV